MKGMASCEGRLLEWPGCVAAVMEALLRKRFAGPGLIRVLAWAALVLAWGPVWPAEPAREVDDLSPARRRQFLEELRVLLPKSEPWESWLAKSGELPPDFSLMKPEPYLPEPLRFENGRAVTRETWELRRRELLLLYQHYVLGSIPPTPERVEPVWNRPRQEAAAYVEQIVLGFGTNQAARLGIELMAPEGDGPFPVFLAAWDHRPEALVAVSRGYFACLYAAGETRDDTAAWPPIWPDYDWTLLARRAWAASRCLDFLQRIPVVDTNRIAMAGHGLNGKVALIAAAFDRRIQAVISSSSGSGGACSFRFLSEAECGAGVEPLTRLHPDWFHPRLRFFVGRESRLPVDAHELVACLAPRPCLLSTALHDPFDSVWAVEKTWWSARRMYELFERPNALNLWYRPGDQAVGPEDIERWLDWLDTVFGRGNFPVPDDTIYPSYETWLRLTPESIDPQTFPTNDLSGLLTTPDGSVVQNPAQWWELRSLLRDKIFSVLGRAPSFATARVDVSPGKLDSQALPLGGYGLPPGLGRHRLHFGNHLSGDLYYPAKADQSQARLPALVWLHPISTALGYVPAYHHGTLPYVALAQRGFVVLAYDQIGHGSRLQEIKYFYHRYPGWSLLGKQIDDALAAVDALLQIDFVDPRRLYLVGYGLGGKVALHAGALDERVSGVASVAGFTPLRLDGMEKGTGGVARWSRWYPLHPQIGPFLGQETRIPYDYHELLALLAPRPTLLFTPRIDDQSTLEDVRLCVQAAATVYEFLGQKDNLRLQVLPDYHRLSGQSQHILIEHLARLANLKPTP